MEHVGVMTVFHLLVVMILIGELPTPPESEPRKQQEPDQRPDEEAFGQVLCLHRFDGFIAQVRLQRTPRPQQIPDLGARSREIRSKLPAYQQRPRRVNLIFRGGLEDHG